MLKAMWGDWVFLALAAVVGLLSLLVLYFALLHDRPRGRRRCPRCWYDMSGTPGLTCSECGKTVKRERTLRKIRRHKRWALVGFVLAVGALASGFTPKVKNDGWHSIAPNTVLILCAPRSYDRLNAPQWRRDALVELIDTRLQFAGPYARVDRNALWWWQWRLLLAFDGGHIRAAPVDDSYRLLLHSALVEGVVHDVGLQEHFAAFRKQRTPHVFDSGGRRLFTDAPFVLEVGWSGPWQSSIESDFTVTMSGFDAPLAWERVVYPSSPEHWRESDIKPRIAVRLPPGVEPGEHRVSVRIDEYVKPPSFARHPATDRRLLHSETVEGVISLAGSYHNEYTPNESAEIEMLVRANFAFRGFNLAYRGFNVDFSPVLRRLEDEVGAVARVELLRDGAAVGATSRSLSDLRYRFARVETAPDNDSILAGSVDGTWSLRISMDHEAMAMWNLGSRYWPGVIDIPIDWTSVPEQIDNQHVPNRE